MSADNDVISLLVTLGPFDDDSLALRFPPEYRDEILELLDEEGIDHNTSAEYSAGPTEWIEVVKVLSLGAAGTGGLHGLAKVITAFVRRHDGKRFVFTKGGESFEATGYSQSAAEAMLEQMPQAQADSDAATRRGMGIDE